MVMDKARCIVPVPLLKAYDSADATRVVQEFVLLENLDLQIEMHGSFARF